MHNRFDRFVKRLARKVISPGGLLETDAEVSPDAQRIDVWFTPDPERARAVLAPLGLFGRICRRACTLEPFHRTPSGEQVADCIAKHRFFCRELARRKPRPPAPMQWVLSAGRPEAALVGLGFRRSPLGRGIYVAPPLLRTCLIVISELPRTRDTLMIRLMGAGRTLREAISDARALPPDAVERRLALPILVRLRLEVPADPAKQTAQDREFLMSTLNIEKYLGQIEREGLEKGLEKGLRKGRDEGFAEAVLVAYRARFGAPPATLVAAVRAAKDQAALRRWLEMVTTRPLEEVTSALPPTRSKARTPRTTAGKRPRPTANSGSRTTAAKLPRTTAGKRPPATAAR